MSWFSDLLSAIFGPKDTNPPVSPQTKPVIRPTPVPVTIPVVPNGRYFSINKAGLDIIKEREGLRLSPYQDTGGVWTIGYGHTKGVTKNTPSITLEQAESLLLEDIAWAEQAVRDYIKVPLNRNQFSALVSLVFNLGPEWIDGDGFKDATFIGKLNRGDYDAVPAGLMQFVYDNGVKLNGLVTRRQMEAKLFTTPV